MEYDTEAITVLRKMYLYGYIGGKHTSIEALKRGFPSHAKGGVEKAIKKLVKEDLIKFKPTGYGKQYSLNPLRIQEIKEIVE